MKNVIVKLIRGPGMRNAPPSRGRTGRPDSGISAAEHLAEDVLQDAAVAVVVGLAGRVDADDRVELDAGVGGDLDRARGGAVVELGDAGERERLGAGQAERL